MVLYNEVKPSSYFDSVTLMVLSSNLSTQEGVNNASVMMATEKNKEIMLQSNLLTEDSKSAGANDLIIAIDVDDESMVPSLKEIINESLQPAKKTDKRSDRALKTMQDALSQDEKLNLTLISTPGAYAALEAKKAILNNSNIFMFSDHVELEDEITLKNMALERNLFMMGPDCGTAILNGIALGFANEINRGNIGIVGASGTGIQEVTSLIHNLGGGVSQAIGVGGRDLSIDVGGKMMLYSIDQLMSDVNTDVIVLISKPPAPNVAKSIYEKINNSSKPVVICFIGSEENNNESTSDTIYYAPTLTDTAKKALELANVSIDNNQYFSKDSNKPAKLEANKYIRALYSGGTLCHEAIYLMTKSGLKVHSNLNENGSLPLSDVEQSLSNTFLDMGEDYFTENAPHPMIDLSKRLKRLEKEADDPEVGIILLDVVIGYGSHPNPAGELAQTIHKINQKLKEENREIVFISSVCGTELDPQVLSSQKKQLLDVGVHVYPSNSSAVQAAIQMIK